MTPSGLIGRMVARLTGARDGNEGDPVALHLVSALRRGAALHPASALRRGAALGRRPGADRCTRAGWVSRSP
jgi:hypothetical protein